MAWCRVSEAPYHASLNIEINIVYIKPTDVNFWMRQTIEVTNCYLANRREFHTALVRISGYVRFCSPEKIEQ